jgi:hypothetical protein
LRIRGKYSRFASIFALILLPAIIYASPTPKKQKESITVEVASTKTDSYVTYAHLNSLTKSRLPKDSYTYTDVIFAIVNGKHVVYSCAERKKVCPLLENGTKLSAERDGDSIYLTPPNPSDKKASPTHYRLAPGGW